MCMHTSAPTEARRMAPCAATVGGLAARETAAPDRPASQSAPRGPRRLCLTILPPASQVFLSAPTAATSWAVRERRNPPQWPRWCVVVVWSDASPLNCARRRLLHVAPPLRLDCGREDVAPIRIARQPPGPRVSHSYPLRPPAQSAQLTPPLFPPTLPRPFQSGAGTPDPRCCLSTQAKAQSWTRLER